MEAPVADADAVTGGAATDVAADPAADAVPEDGIECEEATSLRARKTKTVTNLIREQQEEASVTFSTIPYYFFSLRCS